MTTKELKIKITEEADRKKWYDSIKLSLNLPNIGFSASLEGIVSIHEFVSRQAEGFASYQNLPQELEKSKKRFQNIKVAIEAAVNNPNIGASDTSSSISNLVNNPSDTFLYDCPETIFLNEIIKEKPDAFSGAFSFLIGQVHVPSNRAYFMGQLLAYEFISKNFSTITERKNSEKKSIERLRGDFQKMFEESETQLTGYLDQANKKYLDYSDRIDQFKKKKEGLYNDWFDKASNGFSKFSEEANGRIKDLEELYTQKLKLEAPAQYWNKRASKLKKEGYWWLLGLCITLVLAIVILVGVLDKTADGTLKEIFKEVGTAVKWSIVLITLISFLAYAIRTFAKLMFSSFHLSRDAEEREQLTYVYLALQKEKVIDTTERHMIMQSLFSRADSGLLKDDSSPTMPGNIVDKLTSGGN